MSIRLYYAPKTRAGRVRWLLEELGAPYELVVVDRAGGECDGPEYRKVHPLGNVPALADGMDTTFLECTYPEKSPRAHMSLEELREHRGELACPQLVLMHVYDAVRDAQAARPVPGAVVAEDGTAYPIVVEKPPAQG